MLCPKDKAKCVREILHNFFSCLLQHDKELCLCEKAYYDWAMAIYPSNLKTTIRIKNFQPELLTLLLQHEIFIKRFVPWITQNKRAIVKSIKSEHQRSKIKQFFYFLGMFIAFFLNFTCRNNNWVQHVLQIPSFQSSPNNALPRHN